jgi:hypothetical protein
MANWSDVGSRPLFRREHIRSLPLRWIPTGGAQLAMRQGIADRARFRIGVAQFIRHLPRHLKPKMSARLHVSNKPSTRDERISIRLHLCDNAGAF